MLLINCLMIPLVFLLVTLGTLVLRRDTGKLLIGTVVCTLMLLGIIIWQLLPTLDAADNYCGVGGTPELYQGCRTQIIRQMAVRMAACIAVPTAIGLAYTMALHYLYDRQSHEDSADGE